MEHMINWQELKCFVLVTLYPTIHCSGLATHQCISEIPEMTTNSTTGQHTEDEFNSEQVPF